MLEEMEVMLLGEAALLVMDLGLSLLIRFLHSLQIFRLKPIILGVLAALFASCKSKKIGKARRRSSGNRGSLAYEAESANSV